MVLSSVTQQTGCTELGDSAAILFGRPWRRVGDPERSAPCLWLLVIVLMVAHSGAAFAEWRSTTTESVKIPLDALPQITVVREEAVGVTVVHLKNTTKTALQYRGEGEGNPSTYWEEFKKGRRIETHWPWCGVGIENYVLMPGAQITMRFPDEDLEPGTRVYSIIRSADGKQGSLLLLCERELRPTDIVHTVVKGDTLTGIAKRFKVSVQDLLVFNPRLVPDRLRIGQKVRVKEVEK